jgi:hypothetical protein
MPTGVLLSKTNRAAWCLFAAFHLCAMLWFATIRSNFLTLPGRAVSFLSAYGYLTGSSSGFSFFAPRVSDEPMAEITVHRKDSQYSFTLGSGNAERLRRVSTLLLQLDHSQGYLEGAALFGSYVFSHDDTATKVDVRFYRYQVGKLRTADFLKPRETTVYFASFARSKDYARQ